ncbi:ABC transporter permease [Glycomyces sp. TRM65418]|uniref:ABC transporter permease n=1 Tax=Glycomyces sp. TRM65418 TaxID=2867006 RepID=UPI001CE5AB0A|nr:ABC transporter permease [Glycomyces sp. TRM65418]MCC3763860.1 ABC transporter permease [Glycomyces sp. TRM65418]QZD53563.1 ABC transporter permease [Glycomyces sp. TRM65418]
MRWADIWRTGAYGLRARPMRVVLSAIGIAIGIAAMVAVVGISASSSEDLKQRLDALGTNLLTVAPGQSIFGEASQLPLEAEPMIERVGPVLETSATGLVDAAVYRTDRIPEIETGGMTVQAARPDLLDVVAGEVADGSWLTGATEDFPAVVLGADAAAKLGVSADPDVQVWLGGQWFTVVGVLEPVALAPELDTAALVGWESAEEYLGFDSHPTTVYTRASDAAVGDVQAVLGATANPEHPDEVEVSRPSDALVAAEAAEETFTGLLLGLGAVALLVGGVGVANTMVISVLERRGEIGLRRSLGATRGDVRSQFLAESLLLSLLGGAGGVALGSTITAAYAAWQGWPPTIPAWVLGGGVAATAMIGAIAGLYPAIRASRLFPTEALTAP